jgi:hypothetical protein
VAWQTNVIDVNLLISIVIPTSISWTASAGQANVTAAGMPFVIQYASNAIVKIQVKATNPTNSFGDTFSASNILIDDDADPATDTQTQKLTNAFVDWYPGLGVNYIGGTTINAYWFVTVPAGQPTGTYTFTYSVEMAFSSFGSTTTLGYALLFSEPFNSFNASRWVIANWAPRYDPANVAVEAGNLKIKVRPDRAGGEAYTTSTYQYGSFRARMKISPNSGVHSARLWKLGIQGSCQVGCFGLSRFVAAMS